MMGCRFVVVSFSPFYPCRTDIYAPQNHATQQIQAEKEAKKNLRPQDMFLGETDKYSAFDEDGASRFGDGGD